MIIVMVFLAAGSSASRASLAHVKILVPAGVTRNEGIGVSQPVSAARHSQKKNAWEGEE